MAVKAIPNTFSAGATILSAEHNENFSTIYNEFNGNIENANIKSSAGIVDTKLAQIATAGKVSGAALTSLASVPSGAGVLPTANGGLAAGIICMWSGTIATIPTGWYLCNGSNGTPDLRNRFIVCANADDSGVAKSTITGSALASHDTGVMPAHTHTMDAYAGAGAVGADVSNNHLASSHTTPSTSSTGTGTKVIAVFYALAFIQKA